MVKTGFGQDHDVSAVYQKFRRRKALQHPGRHNLAWRQSERLAYEERVEKRNRHRIPNL
jgi:hypothetical protein